MKEKTAQKLKEMQTAFNNSAKDYSDLAMGQEIPAVREDEIQMVTATYFQCIILEKDSWIPVSETVFAQYAPLKLTKIPKQTHIVVDGLDGADPRALPEYLDHISPAGTIDGGKLLCFLSDKRPEVSVTIALKLVSDIDGSILIPPKAILRKF